MILENAELEGILVVKERNTDDIGGGGLNDGDSLAEYADTK